MCVMWDPVARELGCGVGWETWMSWANWTVLHLDSVYTYSRKEGFPAAFRLGLFCACFLWKRSQIVGWGIGTRKDLACRIWVGLGGFCGQAGVVHHQLDWGFCTGDAQVWALPANVQRQWEQRRYWPFPSWQRWWLSWKLQRLFKQKNWETAGHRDLQLLLLNLPCLWSLLLLWYEELNKC